MPRKTKEARPYFRRRKGRPTKLVILHNGREYETGIGECSDSEAQEALADYLIQHHTTNTQERDQAKIAVGEVIMFYLEHHAPFTKSGPQIASQAKALLPFWRKKMLNDVKGSTCRDYIKERGRDVTPSTVRREMVTLQAAINFWHRESPLASVPLVTKPAEGERRSRYLTRKEAGKLWSAAKALGFDHVARFILIGLYTGTRHETICQLRWYDSVDGGHVDVQGSRLYRRGSESKDSKKRRPVSRIPDRLMLHLRRWYKDDMAQGPQAAIIRWKGKPIKREVRAWALVVAKAGLSSDVTPHTLRHTCATWALQSGMELWDVSGLTGMSIKTLETTYGHQDADFQRASAGAFMGVSWAKTGTD